MHEFAPPALPLERERLRVAGALHTARGALLSKPPPDAYDMVQGVVFPVLQALGAEVFDLSVLRQVGTPSREQVRFRFETGAEPLDLIARPAGERLQAGGPDGFSSFLIETNGRDWWAALRGGSALELELFQPGFPEALALLLLDEREPALRLAAAAELLNERAPGQASPLRSITHETVRRLAQPVRNLRGSLQATFDGELLEEIASRTALYYLLCALAVEHDREEIIPAEDLYLPPDEPPAGSRSRPLPRPGWYLLLDQPSEQLEARTRQLLEALSLERLFTAIHSGRSYPLRGPDI